MEFTHPEVVRSVEAASAPTPVARRRRLPPTAVGFGSSIALLGVTAALSSLAAPLPLLNALGLGAVTLFLAATGLALVRATRGFVELLVPRWRRTSVLAGLASTLLEGLMAGFGMLVAYVMAMGFSRGRQLRRFGRVMLPGLRPGSAWAASGTRFQEVLEVPPGVAERWRENGKTEHASVAAFARLTLDLMALGAPPKLVADANRDALDEIRHAEICFSLAQAMDGRPVGPAPFPQARSAGTLPPARPLALAKLAVDSLVDGALHEGVSARIIAALSRRSSVASIREALAEIAADEGRHAAHGWAVMSWCLAEGGPVVASALLGALETLPRQMRSALPPDAASGAWEPWGIHGHRLESDEYAAALAQLTARVRAAAGRARAA